MRNRLLLVLCVSLLAAGSSSADITGGGSGWALYGFQQMDIGDLNDHLSARGMPAPPERFFTTGGGGHGFVGKAVIGGEGGSLLGGSERNARYITKLSGGYGMAKFGFVAYQTRNLFLYPMLGLGGGGLELKVTDFDANPNAITKLTAAAFMLDASIGMEYLVEFGGTRKGAGGMVFGAQVGYTMTPNRQLWDLDEDTNQVDVGFDTIPKIGIEGFYVRIMIGGGGFGYGD